LPHLLGLEQLFNTIDWQVMRLQSGAKIMVHALDF